MTDKAMTRLLPISGLRGGIALSLVAGTVLLQSAAVFAEEPLQLKPVQESVYSNSNAPRNDRNMPAAFRPGAAPDNSNINRFDPNGPYNGPTSGNPMLYGSQDAMSASSELAPSSTVLQGRLVSVPKGTLLSIHLDQPVSSFGTRLGDPINATLENDVYVNDAIAIPAGSQILGQVANVAPAGHLGRHGIVDVRFSGIKLPDGKTLAMNAHVVTNDQSGVLKGDTYVKDIAKGVGIAAGSAATGTVAGTAAGGLLGSAGAGAVFGLGVGALGGLGYAVARKGREVVIPSGARMSLVIDTPVSFAN